MERRNQVVRNLKAERKVVSKMGSNEVGYRKVKKPNGETTTTTRAKGTTTRSRSRKNSGISTKELANRLTKR